jgi:hypothetical protein
MDIFGYVEILLLIPTVYDDKALKANGIKGRVGVPSVNEFRWVR